MKCPMCQKETAPRPENPAAPFCSSRCRMADLSKWIGGDYSIPGAPVSNEDIEAQQQAPVRRKDEN